MTDLLSWQINDPSSRKYFSLLFLSPTPLSPFRILEGLFELTLHPPRALNLASYVSLDLQRYMDNVRCVALDVEGLKTTSKATDGNRDCLLVKTSIVSTDP